MNHLFIMQDGMIDFQKNREYYRAKMGFEARDLNQADMES